MIRRLQRELEERNGAAQGLIANANDAGRDLNESEGETLAGLKQRMSAINNQLDVLESSSKAAVETADRLRQIDHAMTTSRNRDRQPSVIEYRSAGAWISDFWQAQAGSAAARDRLEVFYRTADHQTTPDNPGVIPDPIVGGVINFIDATRPIVNAIGPQALPSGTFHRPHVTQNTSVDRQTSGDSTDVTEKTELVSQKMLIERLLVQADTYGGYVNVSRQNIDWSSPNILDLVVNDLAAQYAIVTEEVTADALATTGASPVTYAQDPSGDELAAAIWEAMGDIYAVTKGQGRPVLAIAPDRLGAFGPLFAPVNPQNAQSTGFMASNFGQGVIGNISGIPVVVSAGLDSGEAFLFSTAAIEVWEQRIGSLQVVEPSVLGVQIAYAGYFATLIVDDDAIIPLEEGTA
jgi:HK97 family phage major capsid protein